MTDSHKQQPGELAINKQRPQGQVVVLPPRTVRHHRAANAQQPMAIDCADLIGPDCDGYHDPARARPHAPEP
eukprot:SAG22_NODE_12465_length_442_cov_0.606414_1_plen_71_part_10